MNPPSGVRPRWPVFLLALPFLASVLGSWAWFNTDIGRLNGRGQTSAIRNQESALTSDLRLLTSGKVLRSPASGFRFCPSVLRIPASGL